MCADAPDTSGINKAAVDSAAIGKEALDWFTAEAARTQDQRDASVKIQQDVATAQLDAMNTQTALAKEYADERRTVYAPLEKQLVEEAQAYDTTGRREAAADAATADVRSATNRAVASSGRTLARMGYTPTVNATKMAQQGAIAEAGAATNARRTVESTGRAMRMDAASLGRGLASSQATAISTGTSAGGTAVGAAGAANSTAASAAGLMGQGFGIGLQGAGQAGSLYGQQASIQGQYGGTDMGGLAALGGAAAKMYTAGMFSEETLKESTGKPLSGRSARMAIERMPVDKGWTYKEGSEADDGGQPHDGPMRADVLRLMGPEAAPTDKTIDPITIQGNLIAAVADISREVRQMRKSMGGRQPVPPRSGQQPKRAMARMEA